MLNQIPQRNPEPSITIWSSLYPPCCSRSCRPREPRRRAAPARRTPGARTAGTRRRRPSSWTGLKEIDEDFSEWFLLHFEISSQEKKLEFLVCNHEVLIRWLIIIRLKPEPQSKRLTCRGRRCGSWGQGRLCRTSTWGTACSCSTGSILRDGDPSWSLGSLKCKKWGCYYGKIVTYFR